MHQFLPGLGLRTYRDYFIFKQETDSVSDDCLGVRGPALGGVLFKGFLFNVYKRFY